MSARDAVRRTYETRDGSIILLAVGDELETGPAHHRRLGHVRGFVDGLPVVRWWDRSVQGWRYEVVTRIELRAGVWTKREPR